MSLPALSHDRPPSAGADVEVMTSTELALSVRDSVSRALFLDDAWWIEQLGPDLLAAQEMAQRSLADNTLRIYDLCWAAFQKYCSERSLACLPADPRTIAAFMVSLAAQVDEQGRPVLDEEGAWQPTHRRPQTVQLYLYAINKAHDIAHVMPAPGRDVLVDNVMRGIRRTFLMTKLRQKDALDLPLLRRLLAAVDADGRAAVKIRDLALAVLWLRTGAGAGVLARLDWTRVELTTNYAELRLPSPRRGSNGERILALRAEQNPSSCPVAALHALARAFGTEGPVFPRLDAHGASTGQAMTKQGLAAAMHRVLVQAGLPSSGLIGEAGRAGAWPREQITSRSAGARMDVQRSLRQIVRSLPQASASQLRDKALLLTGWWGALRRSNLRAMNWRDLTVREDVIEVVLPWQKNDQDGSRAHVVYLPRDEDPSLDAHTALLAWRSHVQVELGGDPLDLAADQPVFCPVDRHGRLRRTKTGRLHRLSGEAINHIVQAYCAAADLDPARFGAHSLRIGFVTEGLKDGKLTVSEVQQVTGHRSVQTLLGYERRIQTQTNNPAVKLLTKIAQTPPGTP